MRHRVDDRGGGADGADLPHPLRLSLPRTAFRTPGGVESRNVVGPRHDIVEKGSALQLPVLRVVDGALEHRLADALHRASVDLAARDGVVQDSADVVGGGESDQRDVARIRIDLHFRDEDAGGKGCIFVRRARPTRAPLGGVGQIRREFEKGQNAIRPRNAECPGRVFEIDGRRFETVRGLLPGPLQKHVRGAQHRGAADDQ